MLLELTSGDLIVTIKAGTTFHPANFLKNIWSKAAAASGIVDKVPYSLRHSFAAWALTLRIDPNRLVRLMGHGSKKMVYEVYGDYIEGLEEDFRQILDYFGRDFIEPKRKHLGAVGYSQNIVQLPQQYDFPHQNNAPNLSSNTFL